jgi:branched-chain amino acid transport system permease protein
VNKYSLLRKMLTFLILAIILLSIPMVTRDPYFIHIFIMVGINIILCASLRLSHMTGIWNLGQIAFYAIGACILTMLKIKYQISFWLLLPFSGFVTALVAIGLGYLTIRVRGLYFVMLTMAFVEVIRLTIMAIPFFGAIRFNAIPPPDTINIPHIFRIEFISKTSYYYLILVMVVIILTILYLIERSRVGETFKSIASSDPLCESVGVNTTKYRVMAFAICSFFAGIAGGVYAPYIGLIAPGNFTTWASIMVFMSLVIGGTDSFWGPVIGAAFMTILPEALRDAVKYEPMISAVILILIIFFLPGGLASLPNTVRSKMRKNRNLESINTKVAVFL